MTKTKSAILFAEATERIIASYLQEFGKFPEYMMVCLAIQNTIRKNGVKGRPMILPNLSRVTLIKDQYIIGRSMSMDFEEIEDFSLENAILRTFSDQYEVNGMTSSTVHYLPKQKFYVPKLLFKTNSQDELVICPWIK